MNASSRPLLPALALVLAALGAGGCMGEPTRELRLPATLKGARVVADGEEIAELRQGIVAEVPLRAGSQVIRVERAGATPLVERMQVSVNDGAAERAGFNVIVARIEEKWASRTVVWSPGDPLTDLAHDFAPPSRGEGVVLLASQPDVEVLIDGRAFQGTLAKKPGKLHDSFVTRGTPIAMRPGKHAVEVRKKGFAPCRTTVEVAKGEFEVLGATLKRLDDGAAEKAP